MLGMIGMLAAWRVVNVAFCPVFSTVISFIYPALCGA